MPGRKQSCSNTRDQPTGGIVLEIQNRGQVKVCQSTRLKNTENQEQYKKCSDMMREKKGNVIAIKPSRTSKSTKNQDG